MVATETIFVLRIVSFNNYSILFFWLKSDGSKLSNFLKEYSRISNQVFNIKTDLLSFFKISIWSFLLEFESLFTKLFKLLRSVDWTRTAKENFSSWPTSVLKPVLLQLHLLVKNRSKSEYLLYARRKCFVSEKAKVSYVHQNWKPDGLVSAKVLSVHTYLEILTQASRKL